MGGTLKKAVVVLVSELCYPVCGVCSLPLEDNVSSKWSWLWWPVAAPSYACSQHMKWSQSRDGPQKYIPGGKGGAFAAVIEEGNELPDLSNSEARTRFV